MPTQRQYAFATLLTAATLPTAAPAAERLAPVVVTATRIAQTADQTLAPVSVITRQEIEALNPQTVVDLLRLQPGVNVARSGGPGGNTSVFLRGANADHVLVLIDGVRVASANNGLFAWTSLNPAQIERIEIVRGPRATLYGSDAIGGVIQIFTRRPQGATVAGEIGSYGTRRASVGYGGGEEISYRVNAAYERTDGFDATRQDSGFNDPDADGMREASVSAGLEAPLGDDFRVESSLWYAEGENEFDNGEFDEQNGSGRVGLVWDTTVSWMQRLNLAYSRDRLETDSFSPFGSDTAIDSRRRSVEYLHDILLGARHHLVAGVSHRRVEADYENTGTDETLYDEAVDNSAVFTTLLLDFDAQQLELGLRYDQHSEFGGHASGQVSWGYSVTPDLRLTAGYGTAFAAPTLNDLHYPGLACFDPTLPLGTVCYAGNPDLGPERSRTADLSLRYRLGAAGRAAVHLFHTEVDDLIVPQGTAPGFARRYINLDEARVYGVEVEWTGDAGPWFWRTSLTAQHARADDGSRLPRRAEEKAVLVLGREIGGVRLQADAVAVNHREDFGDDDLGGYGLLNASMAVPVAPGLELTARIENLTDKDYELINGYRTAGRSYYLGVRYQPGADE